MRTQTVFDSSRKKVNDYIFIYNKYGDQTKIKNIAYNLNKTHTVTFDRIYKGSFLVQEKSSELPYITKHIYNVKGQKTQSVTFLEADTIFSAKRIFHYTYNTKGRLISIKEILVNNDGSISSNTANTKYTYDATGNVITILRPGKTNYELNYEKGLLKSEKTKTPEDLGGIEMADEYSYAFWE